MTVPRVHQYKWVAIGAAVMALGLAVGGWLFYLRKAHALSETDTVVLADFANSTGDSVFDDTLKQALSVNLQQSPFLNIVSDERVGAALKLMARPPDTRLTPLVAREVCQRAESKAFIGGSIANLGSQYVIGLKAVNCNSGDSLAQEQVRATGKEQVLAAMDQAATRLREKLGESLSTVQKFNTPIEQSTTASFEALKAYSAGFKTALEKGDVASIPLFKRAIDLDPNFAMAYAALGRRYTNLGETNLGTENIQKAYKLRDRVSEREKFRISALYYEFATGELEKAIQTYELWAQAYPRDALAHGNLGARYPTWGQYEKAVAETLEFVHLNPDAGIGYANLVDYYAALNRLDEAKAAYQQAQARKLDHPFLHSSRYRVAFLEGDAREMERQVAWAAGKPGAEDGLLFLQSTTEAFSGHLGKARELALQAVETARRGDRKETAAGREVSIASTEADFGNPERARRGITTAIAMASTRDVRLNAAMVLARAGDSDRAQAMADDLAKRFPLHTLINGYWLPTIRAAIEINRKHPSRAIEFLETVSPYQLSPDDTLYSAYLRGLAYLLLHQGTEAAVEFQKILDHRGIVQNDPRGALAHLGLARAYDLQGDTAKARAAYQDFLTLWKDADADIPILREAKAEYGKLK